MRSEAQPASPATGRVPPGLPLAARRDPIVSTVARRLLGRCGVSAGSRVVIGVSGGADSVALLLAGRALAERDAKGAAGIVPVAVHVHHHLRGGDADGDAAFVASLCADLDVEIHVEHVRPDDGPGNLAQRARTMRYEALRRVAASVRAPAVAVAHHGDDQLETLVMALARGAGADGLGGMPWRRPIDDDVALVRPLLDLRADDCRALCRRAGIGWREDASNLDPASARGRLRRDVMPVLEALWNGAPRRATHTAELLAAAGGALERQLDTVLGDRSRRRWPRAALADLPVPIIAAGLRRAAVHAAPDRRDDLGQRLLLPAAEAIADDDVRPRSFDWPGGLHLEITARDVALVAGDDPPGDDHG
jgi:tRNA(Ile)-lysidine synthase